MSNSKKKAARKTNAPEKTNPKRVIRVVCAAVIALCLIACGVWKLTGGKADKPRFARNHASPRGGRFPAQTGSAARRASAWRTFPRANRDSRQTALLAWRTFPRANRDSRWNLISVRRMGFPALLSVREKRGLRREWDSLLTARASSSRGERDSSRGGARCRKRGAQRD